MAGPPGTHGSPPSTSTSNAASGTPTVTDKPAQQLVSVKMETSEGTKYYLGSVNPTTGNMYNPREVILKDDVETLIDTKIKTVLQDALEDSYESGLQYGLHRGTKDAESQYAWAAERKRLAATQNAATVFKPDAPASRGQPKKTRFSDKVNTISSTTHVLEIQDDDTFTEYPINWNDMKQPAKTVVKTETEASASAPAPAPAASTTTTGGATRNTVPVSPPGSPLIPSQLNILNEGVMETTHNGKIIVRLYDDRVIMFDRHAPTGLASDDLGFIPPKTHPTTGDLGPKLHLSVSRPPLGIRQSDQVDSCTAYLEKTVLHCDKEMDKKCLEHQCSDWKELLQKKSSLVLMVIRDAYQTSTRSSRQVLRDVDLRRRCVRAFILIAFCRCEISTNIWGHYYEMWSEAINKTIGMNPAYRR